jgi:hypothetical protein
MPNLVSRLVNPWYPATAIGLEKGVASVVQLERAKTAPVVCAGGDFQHRGVSGAAEL